MSNYKSNFNLHNIIVNIHFYKDNFQSIKEYDTYDNELSEHIRNIYSKESISDIYDNSYSDYNIIGLNILEIELTLFLIQPQEPMEDR